MTFDDYVFFFMTFVFHGWGLTASFFEFVHILYYTDRFGWGFLSSVFCLPWFSYASWLGGPVFSGFLFCYSPGLIGWPRLHFDFLLFILCYYWLV